MQNTYLESTSSSSNFLYHINRSGLKSKYRFKLYISISNQSRAESPKETKATAAVSTQHDVEIHSSFPSCSALRAVDVSEA